VTLACRVFGHQPAFRAEGHTMRWACGRCGQAAGAKEYGSPAEARRYAAAFNKRDADDLGKRAPLIGLLPLRIWRRASGHH
jgi:hypothetical protein